MSSASASVREGASMSIRVTCSCGSEISVEDRFAGKAGKCRKCGERLVIPLPSEEERRPAEVPDVLGQAPRANLLRVEVGDEATSLSPGEKRGPKTYVVQVGVGGIRRYRCLGADATVAQTLTPVSAEEVSAAIRTCSVDSGDYGVLPFVAFSITAILSLVLWIGGHTVPSFLFGMLSVAAMAWWPHEVWKGRQRKTVRIYYDLDEVGSAFQDSACLLTSTLARVDTLWAVTSEGYTPDWKRNAGAMSVVARRRAVAGSALPRGLVTNARVGMVEADGTRLYLFPDRVLVHGPGRVALDDIEYGDLEASPGSVRFVESGRVPRDSQVVDHTWQYVNKNGSPDLRFANNRRLPVVLYGTLKLGAAGVGSGVSIQVSDAKAAEGVASLVDVARKASKSLGVGGGAPPPTPRIGELAADPHPYAWLSLSNRAVQTRALPSQQSWISRLPEWAQPIAVGTAASVPVIAILLFLGRGAGNASPGPAQAPTPPAVVLLAPSVPGPKAIEPLAAPVPDKPAPTMADAETPPATHLQTARVAGSSPREPGLKQVTPNAALASPVPFSPTADLDFSGGFSAARSAYRTSAPNTGRSAARSNPPSSTFVDQSRSNFGYSPTGKSLNVGPRGGIYHYSAGGNKVYHSRKR